MQYFCACWIALARTRAKTVFSHLNVIEITLRSFIHYQTNYSSFFYPLPSLKFRGDLSGANCPGGELSGILLRCLFLKRSEDLIEKITGYLWHKSFIQTIKCSFLNQIIIYQSFYGAPLTFINFIVYFKEKFCVLTRVRRCSEDLLDKIIHVSPVLFDTNLSFKG